MSRFLLPTLILGVCAACVATLCLADPPAPAPQRAEGRKAPAATLSQPVAVSKVATAPTTPNTSASAGATHGIIFVGGKSAINSQPVPPGKTGPSPQPIAPGVSSINSQPVPPGKPAKPIGPGTGDPIAAKFAKPVTVH